MTSGDALLHRCSNAMPPDAAGKPRKRLGHRTIDVHCHIFVPEVQGIVAGSAGQRSDAAALLRTFGERSLAVNAAQLETIGPKLTTVEARLADMDAMGVDMQVISVSPTQYFYTVDEPDMAEAVVSSVNDRIAETVAGHPNRLSGFGTVSLQYPDRAAAQLDHAVRRLGLCGVEISTHVDGVDISDRRFDPFWSRADELGAVVFLHPWGTTVGDRLNRHYLGNTVGQPMETAIALSNLIFDGTLDRHPGVKIVAAHGGGYLPLYINRSDHAFAHRPEACGCALPPSAYLRRIWFDSLVYESDHLRRLIDVAGASQVVLGTDYPFDMGHYEPASLLSAFDDETVAAISGGNAAALLGLHAEAHR
ncbi:amidohydrolase [Sphingomonas sp. CGMCC 1.13654]|uniref:Amidohydrolase n=1 Tax=Sphingomonas chungangi TaxID=2683589 RepID=A0A838L5N2_9SPHN|nr:amidohydrolase family protein [Sphingomonas chungangi]MBA2933496.1 amidohydrolase [Sphingomonas chungangi]MVW54829.1 amidohydrolase family protein [Sphingomonas chungangi]